MKYEGKPPFELIQLSKIPVSKWKGRAVFHPMSQYGDRAYWKAEDCPDFCSEYDQEYDLPPDEPGTFYDAGVVVEWEKDNWRGEPDNPAAHEVYFIVGNGFAFHYPAYNLWTPKDSE